MNVEVVQRRLWKQFQQPRKHYPTHGSRRSAIESETFQQSRHAGKPDTWKLVCPVWGWGGGGNPPPTPLQFLIRLSRVGLDNRLQFER